MAWIQDLHCVMSYYDNMTICLDSGPFTAADFRVSCTLLFQLPLMMCQKFPRYANSFVKTPQGLLNVLKTGFVHQWMNIPYNSKWHFNQYCYDKFVNQWIFGKNMGSPIYILCSGQPNMFFRVSVD